MTEPAADEAAARPSSLLAVQLWDAILVCFAFLEVMGVFGTSLPAIVQVLLALQGATFMASIVIVMMALTRRFAWVRTGQIVVFAVSAGFIAAATATQVIRHDVDPSALPGAALLVLVDLLAILLLTSAKIRGWYMLPGTMPAWMRGTIALWLAGCLAAILATALA